MRKQASGSNWGKPMISKRKTALVLSICLLWGGGASIAQDAAGDSADHYVTVDVGVTGGSNKTGLEDPVTVLRRPEIGRLMQDIADAPRDRNFINAALKDSDVDLKRLVSLGLLAKNNGTYVLNFPYFTREDTERLVAVLTPYAEQFAQLYRDDWAAFSELFSQYDIKSVPEGALAYAIIGAFSLDWDGLTVTAENNYRITADNMPQGQDFIVWAKERPDGEFLKGLFWGSHNWVVNDVRFTTFGDHTPGLRVGIPDFLWRVSTAIHQYHGETSEEAAQALVNILRPYYLTKTLEDLGPILLALRDGEATADAVAEKTAIDSEQTRNLLTLLEALQYVEKDGDTFSLIVPVFTTKDYAMLRAARNRSNQMMIDWLADYYDEVEQALGDLTVMKYGVPYDQLYTQIWHYIFGLVNQRLVATGHMLDPYAADRAHQSFAPFVFETSIFDREPVKEAAPAAP